MWVFVTCLNFLCLLNWLCFRISYFMTASFPVTQFGYKNLSCFTASSLRQYPGCVNRPGYCVSLHALLMYHVVDSSALFIWNPLVIWIVSGGLKVRKNSRHAEALISSFQMFHMIIFISLWHYMFVYFFSSNIVSKPFFLYFQFLSN